MIVSLISNRLINIEYLRKIKPSKMDDDSKYVLFSFLSSWDLNFAKELDEDYIIDNFTHIIEANKVPIKQLIAKSREESFFNIIVFLLEDINVQFHFNQEIQRIISNQVLYELTELEYFIENCIVNEKEHVIEFICDLFELTSVQEFLIDRWNIITTEKIYKNFCVNPIISHEPIQKIIASTLNRFKSKIPSNLAVVARQEIEKLHKDDKDFIFGYVSEVSSKPITNFELHIMLENNSSWDWKDYANSLVQLYKDMHPYLDTIDLYDLVNKLGFNLLVKDFKTENFDACLIRDGTLQFPIIIVNSSKKSEGRINFSIAHEIAHAVIPHHSQKNYFCFMDDITETNKFVSDKKLETEANNFAGYLLLPDRKFKEDIKFRNFDVENVKELSIKYKSSLVLVSKKWVEHSNLEIAVVFSNNGKIDWTVISDNFPYKWLPYIDDASSVYNIINSKETKPMKKRVNSSNWSEISYPQHKILEESYKLFDNIVMTLLQIDDDM